METEGALGTVATGLEKNLRNAKATVTWHFSERHELILRY